LAGGPLRSIEQLEAPGGRVQVERQSQARELALPSLLALVLLALVEYLVGRLAGGARRGAATPSATASAAGTRLQPSP
jgi:hypothetical protein